MPKFMDLEEQVKLRDFQIMELNSKLEDSTTFTCAVVTSPPNSADLLLVGLDDSARGNAGDILDWDDYDFIVEQFKLNLVYSDILNVYMV